MGNNMKKRSWLQSRSKSQKVLHLQTAECSRKLSVIFFLILTERIDRFILSIHKLIMLENKASGCSHAFYSERLFTVNVSKIESDFQASFFQGYLETNAILFPCENAGVSWHIFMARWRKFALNLFCFFDVSRNVTLGDHLCLALSVSSCQQFRWHNPKQLFTALSAVWVGGPGCHLCPLYLVVGEAFRSHGLYAFNPAKQFTCLLSFYHVHVCWSGIQERDGEK